MRSAICWVYRYRNQSEGVVVHTDKAAVSFNFRITPDDANGVPGHGGLMVYAKDQPYDWDWMRFNTEKSNPEVKSRNRRFSRRRRDRHHPLPRKPGRHVSLESVPLLG